MEGGGRSEGREKSQKVSLISERKAINLFFFDREFFCCCYCCVLFNVVESSGKFVVLNFDTSRDNFKNIMDFFTKIFKFINST
jgi:hypothetical protein